MHTNIFSSKLLHFDVMNEADVRAEFLDPLLRTLGYQAGTENNIIREGLLRHRFLFLGRKKKSDPQLSGKPDYVMESGAHGRWVLEAKPPNQPLTREEFEQAQSYAVHPNVAGALFAISNGRDTRIYRTIDQDFDNPILRFDYGQIDARWLEIQALLSPMGFKRHFPSPTWNSGLPIAPEYSAAIRLGSGEAIPHHVETNLPNVAGHLDVLANLTNHIARGRCWRDTDGRLKVECDFRSSSAAVEVWLRSKGLASILLETDDQFISRDESKPSLTRGSLTVNVDAGEQMFDISTWQMITIPFAITVVALVNAAVFLTDKHVLGEYSLMLNAQTAIFPGPLMIEQVGSLSIDVLS